MAQQKKEDDNREFLPLVDFSTRSGISVATARRMITAGELRAFQRRPGGKWWIHRDELDRLKSASRNEQTSSRLPGVNSGDVGITPQQKRPCHPRWKRQL